MAQDVHVKRTRYYLLKGLVNIVKKIISSFIDQGS